MATITAIIYIQIVLNKISDVIENASRGISIETVFYPVTLSLIFKGSRHSQFFIAPN